ncbi:MAG TPA: hypothetical protein VF695_00630 [Sphingomonas sp.]|jgi:hypothetical protein
MDDQRTPWEETTGLRLVTGSRSTPGSTGWSDDAPKLVSDEAFVRHLTPCLTLVSGVGMTREERSTWMDAAWLALNQFTEAEIKLGAAGAMRQADHPSKIVATIVRTIAAERESRYQPHAPSIARPVALPAPGDTRCTADEAREICKRFKIGSFALAQVTDPHRPTPTPAFADKDRPCRNPTPEDYQRLFGIDPVAERAKGEAARAALLNA